MSSADARPRVLVDANVLLDIVLHRSRFVQDALRVMALGFNGRAALVTTASVVHSVRYVAVRSRGRGALEVLDAVLRQITFIPESVDSVRAGLSFDDPEDASIALACLEEGIVLLATRDVAGFAPFQDRGLRPMLPAVVVARLSQ